MVVWGRKIKGMARREIPELVMDIFPANCVSDYQRVCMYILYKYIFLELHVYIYIYLRMQMRYTVYIFICRSPRPG